MAFAGRGLLSRSFPYRGLSCSLNSEAAGWGLLRLFLLHQFDLPLFLVGVLTVQDKFCSDHLHRLATGSAAQLLAGLPRGIHVELRCDAASLALLGGRGIPAAESDWDAEYDDYILAVHLVKDAEEAIDFINTHGTGHSEAIVTTNYFTAQHFLDAVDAAAVYANASTRFTDGGEFGLGAEIGISTQKMHARGPMTHILPYSAYPYSPRTETSPERTTKVSPLSRRTTRPN